MNYNYKVRGITNSKSSTVSYNAPKIFHSEYIIITAWGGNYLYLKFILNLDILLIDQAYRHVKSLPGCMAVQCAYTWLSDHSYTP